MKNNANKIQFYRRKITTVHSSSSEVQLDSDEEDTDGDQNEEEKNKKKKRSTKKTKMDGYDVLTLDDAMPSTSRRLAKSNKVR